MDTPDRLMAFVLLLVVLAGLITAGVSGLSGSGTSDTPNPPTPSSQLAPSQDDSEDSASSDPVTDSSAAESAAQDVYSTLIATSQKDKAQIQVAAQELNSCTQLGHAAMVFEQAHDSRAQLIEAADAFDTSALPDLDPLLATLKEAWTYSEQADAAFAEASAMRPCGNRSPQVAQATQLSTQSHPLKDRAAELWNDIADVYSLPHVSGAQL